MAHMANQQKCSQCGGKARVFDPGTISVQEYFKSSPDYAIAEGGKNDRLPLYVCMQCGHGFTPITIDPSRIVDWYAAAVRDEVFLADEAARTKTAQEVLKRIAKAVSSGALLDIGAGPGIFVAQAKAAGYDATGLEPSAWAVQHARSTYGVNMIEADLKVLRSMAEHSFSVVTLFDVIEHVVHPHELLELVNRVLKPDGLLVITTPKFDSLLARAMGKRWYCIFPAHIHYFTSRSLIAALEQSGYEVIAQKTHTRYLSASYFLYRLRAFFVREPLVYSSSLKQSMLLPINFGDEFEVYARKTSQTH